MLIFSLFFTNIAKIGNLQYFTRLTPRVRATRAQSILDSVVPYSSTKSEEIIALHDRNQHHNEVGYHHLRPIKKSQRKVTKKKEITLDNPIYTRKIPNQRQVMRSQLYLVNKLFLLVY